LLHDGLRCPAPEAISRCGGSLPGFIGACGPIAAVMARISLD
jgi:hypothetical protein